MSKKKHKPSPAAPAAAASQRVPKQAAAQAAESEPGVSVASPSSAWPFVALGVLLFGCFLYVENTGGAFRADVFQGDYKTPPRAAAKSPEEQLLDRGRQVYAACAACHQPSGLGAPGQFPPLAGSEWVLHENPNRVIRLVLDGVGGPMTVKGAAYSNVMVPWRDVLSDADVAAVSSFIRNNSDWGNKASFVTPAQVKAIRDETKDRSGRPWTADELLKVP
jgi:mono/diheme cytochrome c family protein